MSEIELRARLASLPPMLAKARALLTRFWGRSSWEARSELLRVARMLLTLGAAQPALQAPLMPKHRPRRARQPRRQNAVQAPRKKAETT
jgi:hypothetical protein